MLIQDKILILFYVLQMHWYRRRPHWGSTSPLPSISAQHRLRFAWCCKASGYLNSETNEALCPICYALSPLAIKEDCTFILTHILSDGLIPPLYDCANCDDTLIVQLPVSTCYVCTQVHLGLMTHFEESDREFDDLIDPLMIYISGHDFDVVH